MLQARACPFWLPVRLGINEESGQRPNLVCLCLQTVFFLWGAAEERRTERGERREM